MYSYTKHLLKIGQKEIDSSKDKVSMILMFNIMRHMESLSNELDEMRSEWAKECAKNLLRK